ncbi:MAG: hypothetical protein NT040_03205 [Bacteroidetes bacterium]|nr:hypothetical protein [Bacteroidota bacterium]
MKEFKIADKYRILLFSLLLITTILFLFRGFFQQGMCMDEVNRINALVPLFNKGVVVIDQSILNITVVGTKIPLMFKSYISTLYVLPYIPLMFFDDYLFGVRVLHLFYFILAIIASYLVMNLPGFKVPQCFNVSNRKDKAVFSFLFLLLVATSPLLYPEIRIRFSDCSHVLALTLSYYFLSKFHTGRKTIHLFLGVFIIFLEMNYLFYFSWIVFAVFISLLVLYPRYVKGILKPKYLMAVFLAMAAGLFNHIYYNISAGFPAVKTIVTKIFYPAEYNLKYKIDLETDTGFYHDISIKITNIPLFYNRYFALYFIIFVFIAIFTGITIFNVIRKKNPGENKQHLFVFLTLFIVLFSILLSPNTTRIGHYAYTIPFWELSVISMIIIGSKMLPSRYGRIPIYLLLVAFIGLNFFVSNKKIQRINITRGKGYFSASIYKLKDYLDTKKIIPENVVAIDWGFTSQLYFLSKGHYCVDDRWLGKFIKRDYTTVRSDYVALFAQIAASTGPEIKSLYFPVYYVSTVNGTFRRFLSEFDVTYAIEKSFPEVRGDTSIIIYRIDNPRKASINFYQEQH